MQGLQARAARHGAGRSARGCGASGGHTGRARSVRAAGRLALNPSIGP